MVPIFMALTLAGFFGAEALAFHRRRPAHFTEKRR